MYASLSFGSTKILATRPKFSVSLLPALPPELPTCSRKLPCRVNFRRCESGPPLPPTHTLSMWSTKMPWFEAGHS